MNRDALHSLPGGRQAGLTEYGDPQGKPVLFCHGAPGSRLTITPAMSAAALRLRLRLVAVDRPGYGRSDPHPQRRLADWPADAAVLMDALGIARFSVLGYSLGGAYALACAARLPQRIDAVALCGSLSEGEEAQPPVIALARQDRQALHDAFAPLENNPEALYDMMQGTLSAADQAVLARAEVGAAIRCDCEETLRQGPRAMLDDFHLAAGDWGLPLQGIDIPVGIWHGLDDANVPPAAARRLAAVLPRQRLHLLPGEGHLCLFTRWESLLEEVSAAEK